MENKKSGLTRALVEFWETQKEDATPERLLRATTLFLATQGFLDLRARENVREIFQEALIEGWHNYETITQKQER